MKNVRFIPTTRMYIGERVWRTTKSWQKSEGNPYLYFELAHGKTLKFKRDSLDYSRDFREIIDNISVGNVTSLGMPLYEANFSDLCIFYFFYTSKIDFKSVANHPELSENIAYLLGRIKEVSVFCQQPRNKPANILKKYILDETQKQEKYKSNDNNMYRLVLLVDHILTDEQIKESLNSEASYLYFYQRVWFDNILSKFGLER
ncbi:hypothetical protein ACFL52_01570 [Candidatus Margulisiibacteriota bacterium]